MTEQETIAQTDAAIDALVKALEQVRALPNGVLRTVALHRLLDQMQRKPEPMVPKLADLPTRWDA